jgi:hypothetical protein
MQNLNFDALSLILNNINYKKHLFKNVTIKKNMIILYPNITKFKQRYNNYDINEKLHVTIFKDQWDLYPYTNNRLFHITNEAQSSIYFRVNNKVHIKEPFDFKYNAETFGFNCSTRNKCQSINVKYIIHKFKKLLLECIS